MDGAVTQVKSLPLTPHHPHTTISHPITTTQDKPHQIENNNKTIIKEDLNEVNKTVKENEEGAKMKIKPVEAAQNLNEIKDFVKNSLGLEVKSLPRRSYLDRYKSKLWHYPGEYRNHYNPPNPLYILISLLNL